MNPEQMMQMQAEAAEKAELQHHANLIGQSAAQLARQNAMKDAQIAALQREIVALRAKLAEAEKTPQKPEKQKGAS